MTTSLFANHKPEGGMDCCDLVILALPSDSKYLCSPSARVHFCWSQSIKVAADADHARLYIVIVLGLLVWGIVRLRRQE